MINSSGLKNSGQTAGVHPSLTYLFLQLLKDFAVPTVFLLLYFSRVLKCC